jgi:hypothetical protein
MCLPRTPSGLLRSTELHPERSGVKYSPPLHYRPILGIDTKLRRGLVQGPKANDDIYVIGHSVNATAIFHRRYENSIQTIRCCLINEMTYKNLNPARYVSF